MSRRFICLQADSRQIRKEAMQRLIRFSASVGGLVSDNVFDPRSDWAVIFDREDWEVWEESGINLSKLKPRDEHYNIIHNIHRNDFYDCIIREVHVSPYSVRDRFDEIAAFFCDEYLLHRQGFRLNQKDLLGQDLPLDFVNRDFLKRESPVNARPFLAGHGFHYDFHYDMLSYKDRYVIYKDDKWITTN